MPRRPETRAIHPPEVTTRQAAVVPPVVRSTTFRFDDEVQEAIREDRARDVFLYSRYRNPTVDAAAGAIAALEGSEDALLTASGMAAVSTTLFALLEPGDRVAAPRHLYGATYNILTDLLTRWGVETRWFDLDHPSPSDLEGARIVWTESVSNPMMQQADIPRLADLAHAAGGRLVVDNTFLGPALYRPLEHGADLVIESATKSLGGHHDLMAGVIAGSRSDLDHIWKTHILLGGCLDPEAAHLLTRGLKTLHLRVRQMGENARQVHALLEEHPRVSQTWWADRGAGAVAWDAPSAMILFAVEDAPAASRVVDALRLITSAPSLGGVESLASIPAFTSHPVAEQRAQIGLPDGAVRLSIGCEHVEDLVEDLRRALESR